MSSEWLSENFDKRAKVRYNDVDRNFRDAIKKYPPHRQSCDADIMDIISYNSLPWQVF
jgi:hypothetical protein